MSAHPGLFQGQGFPIAAHSVFTGGIQVVLPESVPTTSPDSLCPILKLRHKLKIRAITEGNVFTKAKSTAKFPVLVGARFLQYTPPPQVAPVHHLDH